MAGIPGETASEQINNNHQIGDAAAVGLLGKHPGAGGSVYTCKQRSQLTGGCRAEPGPVHRLHLHLNE